MGVWGGTGGGLANAPKKAHQEADWIDQKLTTPESLLFVQFTRRVQSLFCNLRIHCIQGVFVSSEV